MSSTSASNPYAPPTTAAKHVADPRHDAESNRFVIAIAVILVAAIGSVRFYAFSHGFPLMTCWLGLAVALAFFRYGRHDAYVGLAILLAFGGLGLCRWWQALPEINSDEQLGAFLWYFICPGLGPGVLIATPYAVLRGLGNLVARLDPASVPRQEVLA